MTERRLPGTSYPDRYPGYDVLDKRHTPSWNEQTRRVVDSRLAVSRDLQFCTAEQRETIAALADRIVPQPGHRARIPVEVMIDHKLRLDVREGYRDARLPPLREAWTRGLAALDAEAAAAHGRSFRQLHGAEQDAILKRMQEGALRDPGWGNMPPKLFFKDRLVHDMIGAYYAFPDAWNEIGFGGPASPRGYVRMGFDKRDSWEAVEAHHEGDYDAAARKNRHVG